MTNTSRMTLLLAVAGCLFGGFFAIEEWFFHSSFKTNDSMIWTLPLITYIFLALMSTGASILLALAEILDDDWLKQNKRQLLLTAIAEHSIPLSWCCCCSSSWLNGRGYTLQKVVCWLGAP